MILLPELCSLDIPHSVLLKSFSSLVELMKILSTDTGDIFSPKVCSVSLTIPEFTKALTPQCECKRNSENTCLFFECIENSEEKQKQVVQKISGLPM